MTGYRVAGPDRIPGPFIRKVQDIHGLGAKGENVRTERL